MYTREEHIQKLKDIRDACMEDANYKTALTAEIAVGKAAGLYENMADDEEASKKKAPPAQDLTDEQIRARIEHLSNPAARLAAPDALMSPAATQTALRRMGADDGDDVGF